MLFPLSFFFFFFHFLCVLFPTQVFFPFFSRLELFPTHIFSFKYLKCNFKKLLWILTVFSLPVFIVSLCGFLLLVTLTTLPQFFFFSIFFVTLNFFVFFPKISLFLHNFFIFPFWKYLKYFSLCNIFCYLFYTIFFIYTYFFFLKLSFLCAIFSRNYLYSLSLLPLIW